MPSLKELRTQAAAGPPYKKSFLKLLQNDARTGAQALYQRCVKQMQREAAEAKRLEAMFAFEKQAKEEGFVHIAGVDEAGRGPLAGPIVAGAVILTSPLAGLNDSKQLTDAQRETLFEALHEGGHDIGVGCVEAAEIDRIGIQAANYRAMALAVENLTTRADFLLVDGFSIPGISQPQKRLIKGDSRSLSIAAASIIAKVTRDRLMSALDREYPVYGFGQHKGYATQAHLDAIEKHGACAVHRKSFAPIAKTAETGWLFDDPPMG